MPNGIRNLIDVPLAAGEQDLLGLEKYTNALVEFIASAQLPTTLAIQGEWGSGKTSLMNQIRHKLCSNKNDGRPYYGVWVNTWQYSLMRDSNEIIINIIEGITSEVVKIIKEKNSPITNEYLHKLGSCFRSVAIASAKAAASSVGIRPNVIDEILAENKVGSNQFAFRDSFEGTIKKCLEIDNDSKLGFLFFIDDLDRIEPQTAVSILEILKNLFEVKNCFFILAIDYDVVVKGLIPRFGELNTKNEREFRSFFDKIVQLPFTMPVAAYSIGDYVGDSLQQIGFLDSDELTKKMPLYLDEGEESISVKDGILTLVENSTGTNPRSIKRLINTLSLINIIAKTDDNTIDNSISSKLIFFGLVCIQISYPTIYNLLYKEPNFLQWDSSFARNNGIKTEDNDKINDDLEIYEIKEEWEKTIFKLSQTNDFLMKKVINIIQLLTFIKNLSADEHNLEECISSLISMTSITSIERTSSNEFIDPSYNDGRRRRHSYTEVFYRMLDDFKISEKIIMLTRIIEGKIVEILGDNIKITYGNFLSIETNYPTSKSRRFLRIYPQKRTLHIKTRQSYVFKNMEDLETQRFTHEFLEDVVNLYNSVSKPEHRVAPYVAPSADTDGACPAADAQTAAPTSSEESGSC